VNRSGTKVSLNFPFLDITWPSLGHEDECLDMILGCLRDHGGRRGKTSRLQSFKFQYVCSGNPCLVQTAVEFGDENCETFAWILRDFLRPDVRDVDCGFAGNSRSHGIIVQHELCPSKLSGWLVGWLAGWLTRGISIFGATTPSLQSSTSLTSANGPVAQLLPATPIAGSSSLIMFSS
jgi:hypothetical protein